MGFFFSLQKPGPVSLSAAVAELPFPVVEHGKVLEEIEQLVVAEEVGRVLRMAELFLIDQMGLENDMPAGLEGAFHLGNQRALEEIKIDDEVVRGRGEIGVFEVGLDEMNRPAFCSG